MKTPIELALDSVEMTETGCQPSDDLPYATHEGIFKIGDIEMKCYRLNTGQTVFDAESVEKFFGGLLS